MVMATAVIEPAVNHVQSTLVKSQLVTVSRDHDAAKQLIGEALHRRVASIDHDSCAPGDEDTFYVADLGDVYRQHLRWKKHLPRVKPFFAVKCNPDPHVLRLLAALGTGFDCASKTEIEQVLGLGVAADRIIYAQPCKTTSYLRFVRSAGVRQMTFDNSDELYKVAKVFPEAELFLRIATDDRSSLCRLSMKFGADMDSTADLLTLARDLGLKVVGVSFHVGSGASDPQAFYKAVRDAHTAFQQGRALGFSMRTLDVGGGFCGDTFPVMAGALADALDDFFPGSDVDVMAEPGRYYVSSAFTVACNVIARRTVDNGKGYMVYINDGVYGNFSSIMFDHQQPVPRILRTAGRTVYDTATSGPLRAGMGIEYSVWGPTCDGIDRISESVRFNSVLDVGDWLYFEEMGAYTRCSATQFNGFRNAHDVVYVCSEPGAQALLEQ
ncbi:ornithine decarboxylase [Ophiocordyceps camponoti-floridani]|uniref:Ornithine decarboxylase n=1 Tax=Ophiocordyceps camponoti-floridani TaxID=2030778 RepID=A0A8H4Q8R5_9HYPO|nr:ornithine decarboxylase [Ophiocordyceps camponoti-floridani]